MPRLVALGDSITRADGSWARLLGAEVLAWDGAVAAGLVREAVPRLEGAYDIGLLYVGVNDARSVAWEPDGFERSVSALLDVLSACCSRVALLTLPRDLGRPTSAPKPAAANAILRAAARRHGASVVALDDLRGFRHVLPDVVHLTAAGQAEVARRVAAVIGVAGPPPARPPGRARWALAWARDARRRVAERRTLAS